MSELARLTPSHGIPDSTRMSRIRAIPANVNIAWSKNIKGAAGMKESVSIDILIGTLHACADNAPALNGDKWRVVLYYKIGGEVGFEWLVDTYWQTLTLARKLMNIGGMNGAKLFVVIRLSGTGSSEIMRCLFGKGTTRYSDGTTSKKGYVPPMVRILSPKLEASIEDEMGERYCYGPNNVRHPPTEARAKKMYRKTKAMKSN